MHEVALALGGGGARGIAHIMVLEAIDEIGLAVSECAGSSIGAVIGAIYASGCKGREIREHTLLMASQSTKLVSRLLSSQALNIIGLSKSQRKDWALVNSRQVLEEFLPKRTAISFEDLRLPMTAVATDLLEDAAVPIRSGPVLPALAASIAYPGLMRPFHYQGRTLIDGGVVDPVPVRHIQSRHVPLVAIDLASEPLGERTDIRTNASFGTALAAVHMMGRQITASRLAERPPQLVLRPRLGQYRSLDFHKMKEIMREFEPFKDNAKRQLERLFADCLA